MRPSGWGRRRKKVGCGPPDKKSSIETIFLNITAANEQTPRHLYNSLTSVYPLAAPKCSAVLRCSSVPFGPAPLASSRSSPSALFMLAARRSLRPAMLAFRWDQLVLGTRFKPRPPPPREERERRWW